jgi:CubicO group peptidase (beta-lactamase class C family)
MRRQLPTSIRAALPALLLAGLLASGCGDASTGPGPAGTLDLTLPWETSPPTPLGVDGAKLNAAAARAAAIPRFRSLVVVRDGRIVLERYWGGAGADDLADVRSGTKSVMSTLVGIALDRGYLESVDQTLRELFPAGADTLRADEDSITVRDLLTMTGGWQWDESTTAGYNDWVTSADPVGYLLERPLAHAPGSVFTYNTAAVNLLGIILEHVTGMSVPAFADQVLFGPLGIADREWEDLPDGHVNGGSGLKLRPRDLARLGQLLLQDGVSGTRQIVRADWVGEATRAHFPWTSDEGGGPTHLSYGYLWWTDADNDAFLSWGYRGQYVYVSPARRLVVVATTTWWAIDGQSAPATLDNQVLDVIVNGVLPAVPPE